jgi:FemAB-related protein (PEP-CTERM system-associated)
VFSAKYFAALCAEFGDDAEILVVEDLGVPIAAVLSFYFRDEVLPYYGGGTPAARSRAGNDAMYWEVMRRAADRGCRIFDFGRSKEGTGAYSFKKNWGFTPTPLNYEFKLRVGDTIPDVNPLNPKYRLMIEMWKRLPLPVANFLGPFLVKNLG